MKALFPFNRPDRVAAAPRQAGPRQAGPRQAAPRNAAWFPIVLSISLGSAMLLSGCVTSDSSTKLINLPDGQQGFALNCSGSDAGSSWAACYVEAGQACGPTGYDIVSKDNDQGGTTGGMINGVFSANVKNRSMVVRCK